MSKEKYHYSLTEEHKYLKTDGQADKKIEQNQGIYKCYYCKMFSSTTNVDNYLKHAVIYHHNKPSYPSKADLDKNNLKPQGKSWEI